MSEAALLAIDQGTSSSRAMAFSGSGELLGIEQQSFESLYPAPGWVEHDPEVLWPPCCPRRARCCAGCGHRSGRPYWDPDARAAILGLTDPAERPG